MFDLIPYRNMNNVPLSLLDHFERRFFNSLLDKEICMRTDIIDKGDSYVVKADLPGFHKEDIQIEVHDNLLQIRAEHNQKNEAVEDAYVRRERNCSVYQRQFSLSGIKKEEIRAEYHDGVLQLELPKCKQSTNEIGRKIPIQ